MTCRTSPPAAGTLLSAINGRPSRCRCVNRVAGWWSSGAAISEAFWWPLHPSPWLSARPRRLPQREKRQPHQCLHKYGDGEDSVECKKNG